MQPNIMIDASHANSNKNFKMQSKVVTDVRDQFYLEREIL